MKKQVKPTIIFVTSRALTVGILAIEAVPLANLQGYMEGPRIERPDRVTWYGPGSYRKTWEEAVARAEVMRSKRLIRMVKQMDQIRAIDFTKGATA